MKQHGSLNHIYRLVWSEVAKAWVAVAETARGRGKGKRRTLMAVALTVTSISSITAQAGPTGGQVTAGGGTITQTGSTTTINQSSTNLALNWNTFNIAPQETVNFVQPSASAIAVNRILDPNGSQIFGHLNANGQVFLINPNGILFGEGAQVNVGGLVASTLDLNGTGGDSKSFGGAGTGSVINKGTINAANGGYVALLGNHVANQGTISAQLGTVALGAGSAVTLTFDGNSLVHLQVDESVLNSLAENGGLIRADGGQVIMSAGAKDSLLASVVNNSGIIEARTVENHGGTITLLGGMAAGTANVGGTLDASAPTGGDGGAIETSAAHVQVADSTHVTTVATSGKTGNWLVDPTDFSISASGGDITGATLSSELASTSVTLASTSGKTSGNGDIFVNDAVSWSANTTLTLNAVRNIQINNSITATGNTAGLVLSYGSGANYYVNGAKITLSGSSPSLSIGGQAYTVINSLGVQSDTTSTTLQGMLNNPSGHYALGSDIDASATSGWSAIQGLVGLNPVGTSTTPFSGVFAGFNHVISNLTVNYANNNYIGMFGYTGSSAIIRDVGLSGGTVNGTDYVGQLVGFNQGTISNSYATGTASDQHYLGGLVGNNTGTITTSYSSDTVTSKNKIVGGLVGLNSGTISNSYATGTVTGVNKMIGGLVGENGGTIVNSYSTGKVGGATQQTGGLVGYNTGTTGTAGTVTSSFWDVTTSAQSTSDGGIGMTTAQMQTQANFTSATTANGNVNPAWDFSGVWQMTNGSSYPLLRGFLTQIIVTASNITETYNGAVWNGVDTYTCSTGNCSVLGTATFGGTAVTAVNAGTYSIVPTSLSSAQGYSITFVAGQLNITPAPLTITGLTANNKVYDTTTTDTLSGTAKVSPFGSDSVTLNGTGVGSFASKNAGTGKAVTVTGYSLSGTAASNYTLVEPVGLTANITQAPLTVTGISATNRVYNATVTDTLSGTAAVTALGSDSVTVSGTGTGTFASKNIGTNKPVTVSGYSLAGADAGNYTLVEPTNLTATVTQAQLTVTGVSATNKVYDATVSDTLSGTATVTAISGDAVTVSGTGTGTFASKNSGSAKPVTVAGYTLSGADAGNYAIVEPTGLTATITQAPLAVTGISATNRVYNATVTDTLSGTATVTALGSDSVTVGGTGTGTFASKNVGTNKPVTVAGYSLSGADAGNYTIVQPTGLTATVTQAPLTVTGISTTNKVYDTTLTDTLSGTATVTAISGDSVTVSGTGTGTFASKNVGTNKPVTVAGYTLSGADAGNYAIVQPAGLTATITQAPLTVTGVSATNKVYDATVSDTLSGTATVTALGSDSVTVGGTGTGTFASKNVGTNKPVTVAGYSLSGADASNYSIVEPTGLTATVTQAPLTVTGISATNRVYNATVTDTLSGTATVTALGSDSVTVSGTGTGTFASKNVGTNKPVTVAGYSLSGADAGNYTIVQPTGLSATVTQASLAVTGVSATNKVYDTTLTDTLSGTATVTAISGDSVTVGGTGTGTFASKNVGTNKPVTVAGYTLSGADAGNYTIVQPSGLTATITQAPLAVTGVSATNKVYDATVSDTLSGTATVTALGSDSVTVGGTGTGTFASKNVGTNKPVTVAGYTLSGADSGNYSIVQPAGLTATITQAPLTVAGVSATNKVYDATVSDTLSGTATVTALSGDTVTVAGTGTGTFANKNSGSGKAVTVTGYTLSGADAGNYTIVEPTNLTATITQAPLAVTGVSAANKVYDATVSDTLSGTATVTALSGDTVTVAGTGTGTFANKNAGSGKPVTVTGYSLTGADAGNYIIVEPANLSATITQAPLAVSGVSATNKVYDTTLTDTLSGTATVTAISGDSVTVNGTGTGTFASKNVGTNKPVTVTGYTLSGADAGNYAIVQPTSLTATITQAPLTVTGVSATNKVYDATVSDTLSGTATVTALSGDTVTVAGTGTGTFANKNAGSGKAVTVTGYSLAGADAGNYTIVEPTNLTATITQAPLAVTGVTATNKVYDTTVADTLSGTATVTALSGDTVSVAGTGTGTFANKNAGSGKAVTVTGYTLSGADAGNYTIVEPTNLTATISQAPLAVTGVSATNKVYDTTVSDTLSGTATVTALGSDVVTVSGTGTGAFANKNAGSGKAVTVTGYSLAGTDAGNYTIVEPTNLTATITQAPLTVTGVSATNKVYDTTVADTLSGTATVTALSGDTVSVAGTGTGTFANKNAGSGKAVTVTGYTLSGADAGNYSIVEPTNLTAAITQAPLAVTGVSATNKVYDTTVNDTLSGTATVAALGSDVVTVSGTGTGAFANKNAGSGKAVTVTGYSLAGTDAGNYTIVEPTNLTATITQAPLTVTGVSATNKVYDTTVADTLSGTATVTALSGDTVIVAGTGTGTFANKNAGSGKAVTVTGYTLSGADAGNYSIVEPTNLTATITQAPLAVTGVTATNKVYDTTVTDTLSGTATVAALGSDIVTVSGTGTGAFANKNAGSGKAVTVTGYSLAGADAGNYTIVEPTSLTATITQAPLAVTGVSATNKVYDTTVADSLSGTATVTALSGDTVSVAGTGTGTFANKNAGSGKTVTVTGYSLAGTDAGNYTIVEPTNLTATITQAPLAVTGVVANNKVYDASTTATLTGIASVVALGADSVTLNGTASATFADKNVGSDKPVTVAGFTLTGTDAGNYTLLQPTGLLANISQANLTISGVTANNKVYDSTVSATLGGTATITALGSDNISLAGTASAAFSDKNVGSSKGVTVTGYTLTGADAGNYNLIEPTNLAANITPVSITVTGVTAANKVYDTTTVAALNGTATVTALGSDNLVLSGSGSGNFADKNVGAAKPVTVTGYTLSGADAGNYTLIEPNNLTANITPATLTVTGLSANNKVYDTTVTAALVGTATVSALGSDNVAVGGTGSGTFSNKNVGTDKAVTVTGYTLTGTDAGNYVLAEPTGLSANIVTANLNITGLSASNKVYDTSTVATLGGSATIAALGSDSVTLSGTGSGTFSNKNVGTAKPVTVTGYTLTGTDAGNYNLIEPTNLTANIAPATITISGVTAANKVYDATVTATLGGSASITALGGDNVSLSGTGSGSFANKNVGTAKPVTVTGYTLTGTDAGNYTLVEPASLTASITPATLTVTGVSASNKVYDTTVAAALVGTATVSALGSDSVAVGGTGSGNFADKNVGTAKPVTVTGYALTGTDAGNYVLAEPAGLSANIVAANLNITGLSASNKVYDTSTVATLGGSASITALGSDNVSLSGTGSGSFANKNVGTAKPVTVTGYTLTGADAGNYNLIEPTNLTANITPATITISGVTAANKVYDATATATLGGSASITALGSDNVSLSGTGSGSFANKNVGTAKPVTVTGYTLTGTDAGNYTLVEPASLTASITPATLTVTGVSASNKVYDTTVAAALVGTATVSALGSDSVAVGGTGSGSFADKNVGTAKPVTVTGYALTGTDAGNYVLAEPAGLSANITPANLLITGITTGNKVYDGTTSATLGGTAAVSALGSDSVTLTGTGSGSFANKNVGNGKTVTVAGYGLSGTDAGNYTLVEPANLTANITPAALTIGATAASRVYDGLNDATATLSDNRIAGDVLTTSYTSATFSDQNAANNKTVTVSGIAIGGTDAGNYTFNTSATATANITKAPLTVTPNSFSTVYSGSTVSTGNGVTYSGLVNNETSSALGGTLGYGGAYFLAPSANAGSYNFKATGLTSTNYAITFATGTLTITPAPLTITANNLTESVSVLTGPFSGGNGVTYSGFVAGQGLANITGTLSFTGTSQGATSAGTYSLIPGGLSAGSNYAITWVNGTLTLTTP